MAKSGRLLTAADIRDIATQSGFDGSPVDVVRLDRMSLPSRRGDVPAWVVGRDTARALRLELGLGSEPIADARLAEIAGLQSRAIEDRATGPGISFALDESTSWSRVVLRSKWRPGRRFELARLLGDRLVSREAVTLFPATRAYTYRQKMQRSFAAEFLSPFETVDRMLDGDYSMENQLDVAEYFGVSELTIRTLLVNNERIGRETLDDELETLPAPAAA
jgi:hypothetical protein